MTTAIAPPALLAAQFKQLSSRWKAETWMHSDPAAICTHPAYQHIIGMGLSAISLIL